MGRSDRGDPYLQRQLLAHERAGGAGMVEVDVREEQMADVAQLVTALGEVLLAAPAGAGGEPTVEGAIPSSVSTR